MSTTPPLEASMGSSEREELKPCPFCGEQDAKVYQQGGSVWDVSCTCGVVGPADITRAGAVEEWNRRAQASAEPLATLHDDGYYTFKRGQEPQGARYAGWRLDVYAAPQQALLTPLTPERVREIVKDAGFDCPRATYAEQAAFISGLRHGEAAHGEAAHGISAGKERSNAA